MIKKEAEIKKHVDLILKDFDFNNAETKLNELTKLLKFYKLNKDISNFEINTDLDKKQIFITIVDNNKKDYINLTILDDMQ